MRQARIAHPLKAAIVSSLILLAAGCGDEGSDGSDDAGSEVDPYVLAEILSDANAETDGVDAVIEDCVERETESFDCIYRTASGAGADVPVGVRLDSSGEARATFSIAGSERVVQAVYPKDAAGRGVPPDVIAEEAAAAAEGDSAVRGTVEECRYLPGATVEGAVSVFECSTDRFQDLYVSVDRERSFELHEADASGSLSSLGIRGALD